MESQASGAYSLRSSTSPMCATSSHSMRRESSRSAAKRRRSSSSDSARRCGTGMDVCVSFTTITPKYEYESRSADDDSDLSICQIRTDRLRKSDGGESRALVRRRSPVQRAGGLGLTCAVTWRLGPDRVAAADSQPRMEAAGRLKTPTKKSRPGGNGKVPPGRGDEPSERPTPGSPYAGTTSAIGVTAAWSSSPVRIR